MKSPIDAGNSSNMMLLFLNSKQKLFIECEITMTESNRRIGGWCSPLIKPTTTVSLKIVLKSGIKTPITLTQS